MINAMKSPVHLQHPSVFGISSCMITVLGQKFGQSEMEVVGQISDFLQANCWNLTLSHKTEIEHLPGKYIK